MGNPPLPVRCLAGTAGERSRGVKHPLSFTPTQQALGTTRRCSLLAWHPASCSLVAVLLLPDVAGERPA